RLFRAYAQALDAAGKSTEARKWINLAARAEQALGMAVEPDPEIIDLGDDTDQERPARARDVVPPEDPDQQTVAQGGDELGVTTFFADYDGILCDLDGVVYAGSQPIDAAVSTLNTLMAQGVPVAFITNNASKSASEVAERLRSMGLNATPEYVMTSAQAVVELLSIKYDCHAGPVLVIGSTQLIKQVQAAGFTVTTAAADRPQVVVQGFNPQLQWDDLAQASFAIQSGAGWLASNLDLTIPLAGGIAPGNGSMVQAVSQATGTRPEIAAGKPAPVMFQTMANF